tara:strand:+ start:2698 stop:3837 length:1140 start_codon:yes stop_codon:yes gene_type:complete
MNFLSSGLAGEKLSCWIFNPGSSSIKWAWFNSLVDEEPFINGQIGKEDFFVEVKNIIQKKSADVAVIRFVHGGSNFVDPIQITQNNLSELKALSELAPLHMHSSLACSKFLLEHFPKIKLIAVFDTEYFNSLPQVSQVYGLPISLQKKHKLRRYGFHGFAHAGMQKVWNSLQENSKKKIKGSRIVTIQLGSGCSMTAIKDNQPIDTSMGFTPNEGLLMSTRCGDIDPGLVTWLQRHEGWSPDETDYFLNEKSGWLGVSEESANMKDLLNSNSDGARLALAIFIQRIHKTLGAYFALMGGLDSIMFSGGIAEQALPFCHRILVNLEHLGIKLSENKIEQSLTLTDKNTYCFSASDSSVACWCIKGNESRLMLDSLIKSLQ